MAGTSDETSALKKQIAESILREAAPYISSWMRTLGKTGTLKTQDKNAPQTDIKTKVQAAGKGMDIVMKMFPDAGNAAGVTDLLNQLAGLEEMPEDDETFPPRSKGVDRSQDSES